MKNDENILFILMQKNKDFGTKIKEIRYKYEIFLKIQRMQKTKEFGAINYFTQKLCFCWKLFTKQVMKRVISFVPAAAKSKERLATT